MTDKVNSIYRLVSQWVVKPDRIAGSNHDEAFPESTRSDRLIATAVLGLSTWMARGDGYSFLL
ncbi:MAG: hypothetical protein ACU83P_00270, partial [Gammaproteobacteria bacterium]